MRLGGNNRSISVGGSKEVKFKKVSRRSRANEFNDARGRAPTTHRIRESCGATKVLVTVKTNNTRLRRKQFVG